MLAVEPASAFDLLPEQRDGFRVDAASMGEAVAELVGVFVDLFGREPEFGVGAAVQLAEQAPVRLADLLVPVLPPGEFDLERRFAHDRNVPRTRERE